MVEPVNPLERGDFHTLTGFPGASGVNQFRFVEAVDGFCQGVIITIPFASHRRFDPRFRQTIGVSNRKILGSPIRVVDQFLPGRLSGIQGLFQRIQNEIRLHGLADSPAHDAPGKHIDDKSHI